MAADDGDDQHVVVVTYVQQRWYLSCSKKKLRNQTESAAVCVSSTLSFTARLELLVSRGKPVFLRKENVEYDCARNPAKV